MNESLNAAMKAEIHTWMNCGNSEQQLADRLAGLAEQHFAGQAKPDADAQETLARIERLEGMIEGHIRQPNAHHGRLEELDKPNPKR